ncbi:DUF6090 family protein [Seonamhaeicola maritimus]|uniref:DUF6090 family protein n=1 Tax=Seonamhaeicola maritimus TaxID=2591822 RepID=UPI002494B55E|nr:DUF6090 family protein [Seonamhaeicola maritimus]
MIKFFRNIRKKLLAEGNKGKYLKYAIGEIVLVVIGILIALSINNWNEERKRTKQEQKILISLKSDFIESKERLHKTMIMQDLVIKRSSALLKIFENKSPIPVNDSIKVYLQYGAFSWYRAELVTGAYDALINAGHSELISNESLSKMLVAYFSILKSGFEDQETSMNLLNNMQIIAEPALLALSVPKLRGAIGLDAISGLDEEEAINFLFKQKAFFGHLYNKTLIEKLRFDIQQDLLVRMEDILTIINKEIST